MCTYVVVRDEADPSTLLFAGNRDERLARPFASPEWHAGVLRPTDHLGGTWMGMSRRLFCALTNAPAELDGPAERSRGLLVRDALETASADAAAEVVARAIAARRHDGFNLLVADVGGARLGSHDGRALSWRDVGAGAHVVEHRSGGLAPLAVPFPAGGDAGPRLRRFAATVLASHESLAATGHPPCRHEGERGTVATMLAAFTPRDPSASFLIFSRGFACRPEGESVHRFDATS